MKSEELFERIFEAIATEGNVEFSQEEAVELYGELLVLRGEVEWAPVDERSKAKGCSITHKDVD